MIAYLIGGPQDMVKLHVTDNEFKNGSLTFAHAKVGAMAVENVVYIKIYEDRRHRDAYAVYAYYSPDFCDIGGGPLP